MMIAVFRPVFGRVLTIGVAAICIVAAVAAGASSAGGGGVWRLLPWLALLSGGCWSVLWRPRVEVSDGGVRIVNVMRTIDVPWPAITGIETRWALTLQTSYGRFAAWAAPSAGRASMRRAIGVDHALLGRTVGRPIAEATHGPASEAGQLVHRRWEELRAAGHLDRPVLERERVPVHWHLETMAAGVVLVVLGVVALMV